MYLSAGQFKSLAKASKLSHPKIMKESIMTPSDVGSRQVKFTVSTETIDRDNDKIDQAGWKLDNYLRNPVVLFGHDATEMPVGKCVSIGLEDGELKAVVEFVPADVPIAGPKAEAVYQLCLRGFLSAVSVGFRPLVWKFSDDPSRGADSYNGGVDFDEQELMEFSVVPIPANPDALIEQVAMEEPEDAAEPVEPADQEDGEDKSLNNHQPRLRLLMKTRILQL